MRARNDNTSKWRAAPAYDSPMVENPRLDPAVFARLARLELTSEELARYGREFEHLFEYFNQIRAVDTTGVEPMVYPTDQQHRTRGDVPGAPIGRDILKNAPSTDGEFFNVPKVIES